MIGSASHGYVPVTVCCGDENDIGAGSTQPARVYILGLAHLNKIERSPMESQEKLAALRCGAAYAKAIEAYSNKFVNGAGMQKPGTRGFELWLIYSTHTKQTGSPPTLHEAIDLAKEYGLNTTSAANALGKWSAYYGFRPARTGEYAEGPRS